DRAGRIRRGRPRRSARARHGRAAVEARGAGAPPARGATLNGQAPACDRSGMSGTATMDAGAAAEAAELLWRLWDGGRTVDSLPERVRPITVDDGWAIQRALDAHAGAAAGWKIAATSAAGQAHIGADGPLAGRLYRRSIRTSGCGVDADSLTMRVAEAEF